MTLTTYRLERAGAERLLFLFHGWSAEQHHLAAYVPLVDPGQVFTAICPRAPHDLPEGDGASWWERNADGPDPVSFGAALDLAGSLVHAEASAADIPLERCVVGGFSQGGFLALALVGRPGAPRYAGVWAMCCGLPEVEGYDFDLSGGDGRPALVQLGEHDPLISPEQGRAAASALDAGGWNVTAEGYDMAHSQTIEMMVDARAWLAAVP